MIAHLEATIDFPEDDLDEVVMNDVELQVKNMIAGIERMLATASAGRVLREGLTTAIIGRPNVGKSSLLNALLREERAIVTDIPGTTRDSIEEYAEVGGVPLRLIDTAGIRESADGVEKIGIARARAAAENASLILALFDGAAKLTPEDEAILALLSEKKDAFLLLTKADQPPLLEEEELAQKCPGRKILRLSSKTGAGLDALAEAVRARIYGAGESREESVFVATEREAALLQDAAGHLRAVQKTMEEDLGADFLTIDLRAAWTSLGKIIGEAVGEDIIDEIFSRFCIGK